MADPRDLGEVFFIGPEAVGVPGQRRFRIKAMADDGTSVSLWLEKEQLTALGDAIDTVLKGENYRHRPLAPDDLPPEPVFPLRSTVEFQVGQLSMGVRQAATRIVLIASEVSSGDDDAAAVQFEFVYALGGELRRRITEVVAAGRPPCPLCGAPLDSSHVCPRSNGHHKQS